MIITGRREYNIVPLGQKKILLKHFVKVVLVNVRYSCGPAMDEEH